MTGGGGRSDGKGYNNRHRDQGRLVRGGDIWAETWLVRSNQPWGGGGVRGAGRVSLAGKTGSVKTVKWEKVWDVSGMKRRPAWPEFSTKGKSDRSQGQGDQQVPDHESWEIVAWWLNLIFSAIWKGNLLFQLLDRHISYPGYLLSSGWKGNRISN